MLSDDLFFGIRNWMHPQFASMFGSGTIVSTQHQKLNTNEEELVMKVKNITA